MMKPATAEQLLHAHEWAIAYIKSHNLQLTYAQVLARLEAVDLQPLDCVGRQVPPIAYEVFAAIGWSEAYTNSYACDWWNGTFLPTMPKYLDRFRQHAHTTPNLIACERGLYPERYRAYNRQPPTDKHTAH
jgi:hypothetical protein